MLFRCDESMALPFAALPFLTQAVTQVGIEAGHAAAGLIPHGRATATLVGTIGAGSKLLPASSVVIPQNFHPDSECYDTSVVSSKKFTGTFSLPHGPPNPD